MLDPWALGIVIFVLGWFIGLFVEATYQMIQEWRKWKKENKGRGYQMEIELIDSLIKKMIETKKEYEKISKVHPEIKKELKMVCIIFEVKIEKMKKLLKKLKEEDK